MATDARSAAGARYFRANFERERDIVAPGAPACLYTTACYGTDGLAPVVSRSLRPSVDNSTGHRVVCSVSSLLAPSLRRGEWLMLIHSLDAKALTAPYANLSIIIFPRRYHSNELITARGLSIPESARSHCHSTPTYARMRTHSAHRSGCSAWLSTGRDLVS